MAAELREAFGTDAILTPGSGGVFTITVDGAKVYDNGKTGRFPRPGEVTQLIRSGSGN